MKANLLIALSIGSTTSLKCQDFSDRCGVSFENSTCGNDNPYGPCCSMEGYCGVSDLHCKPSLGCQSGCAPEDIPGFTNTQRCGTANKGLMCNPNGEYGPCCSLKGYCGSGEDFCTPSHGCQSGCSSEEEGYSMTGRCGTANNGLVCNPTGIFGPCCSEFGFCGRSKYHCLPSLGCQSGCKPPPPAASPTYQIKCRARG
ncbi:hypothetical protein DSO57_1002744 [Entomophthora muscae]|uniref:Uncharacterized protein n=1 Tax=Entomophthora muscae TaxID=34485 RepID=A0ACC2UUC7_9FUNG|nr:hypothetical protein DSO57_1002744 [Entomophthora muscae]